MFGNYQYFGLTRKFVAVFGTLFNDITIQRPYGTDKTQSIKVPLTYASQEKMLAALFNNSEDKKVAAVTPAMSFEVGSPYYDPERKLQSTLRRCHLGTDGVMHQFVGVPYNLDFSLYIYAKNEEDGLRVLENILPYFSPSYVVTVKMVPEMEYKIDVPVILKSVEFDNESYGDMSDRRRLIWTIRFTMKVEFTGPIQTGKKLIKTVHVNLRDIGSREVMEEVHVEPGLTANGTPTSKRSESVPLDEIEATDDFGYIVEINEGPEPHYE